MLLSHKSNALLSPICHMARRAVGTFQTPQICVRNSLSDQLEPLDRPINRPLHWYSCGPTVYDKAHIGHARTYVCTDIIRRVLGSIFQQDVVFAMGVTDIDDKIIQRAQELGLTGHQLNDFVRELEDDFFQDMDALGNLRPDYILRVTEHVGDIVEYVQGIIANGFGYITADGVYFDTTTFGNRYNKFGVTNAADNEEYNLPPKGITTNKRNYKDFALWKVAKPGEPHWQSPWGEGRPGWHIECSAMTHSVFKGDVDIHSGGIDLKFPHHTNEIAQCEAFHDCNDWVKYWLHTGHLYIEG